MRQSCRCPGRQGRSATARPRWAASPRVGRSRAARAASRGTTSHRRAACHRGRRSSASASRRRRVRRSSVAAGPAEACFTRRSAPSTASSPRAVRGAQSRGPPRLNVTEPVRRARRIVPKKAVPVRSSNVPRRLTGTRESAPRQPCDSAISCAGPVAVTVIRIVSSVPKRACQRPLRPSNAIVPFGAARSPCTSSPPPFASVRVSEMPNVSRPPGVVAPTTAAESFQAGSSLVGATKSVTWSMARRVRGQRECRSYGCDHQCVSTRHSNPSSPGTVRLVSPAAAASSGPGRGRAAPPA